jgi:hypothetical protein
MQELVALLDYKELAVSLNANLNAHIIEIHASFTVLITRLTSDYLSNSYTTGSIRFLVSYSILFRTVIYATSLFIITGQTEA